ncbi:MAG: hypothetical protein BWX50_00710 [Euryarchaeota archaeon ADurb.Bin009]|nr:MAG: hypothetical protein BWX50_00710 [Euryarchaeota archaeon ADurb.Bin009]
MPPTYWSAAAGAGTMVSSRTKVNKIPKTYDLLILIPYTPVRIAVTGLRCAAFNAG